VVTGASAGIGRATALAFARAGAHLALADVDAERGAEVAAEAAALGVRSVFVATDVADEAAVGRLVDATVEEFGGLDFAFNNAGIEGATAMTADAARADWDRVLAVNLTGVWLCMRAELPAMLRRGGGAIVNCASVAGLVGFAGSGPYVASKHGVVGLTKATALEYATAGVRVNAVCPGVIDTEMVRRFTRAVPGSEEQLRAAEPVGRLGRAEEVADAVLWLCGDRSGFVTGHALAVDGGYVAR